VHGRIPLRVGLNLLSLGIFGYLHHLEVYLCPFVPRPAETMLSQVICDNPQKQAHCGNLRGPGVHESYHVFCDFSPRRDSLGPPPNIPIEAFNMCALVARLRFKMVPIILSTVFGEQLHLLQPLA